MTLKVVRVRRNEELAPYKGRASVDLDLGAGLLSAGAGRPGWTVEQRQGHALGWHIPNLRASAANRLLARLRGPAAEIVAGYSVGADGRGRLDATAKSAIRAIEEELSWAWDDSEIQFEED